MGSRVSLRDVRSVSRCGGGGSSSSSGKSHWCRLLDQIERTKKLPTAGRKSHHFDQDYDDSFSELCRHKPSCAQDYPTIVLRLMVWLGLGRRNLVYRDMNGDHIPVEHLPQMELRRICGDPRIRLAGRALEHVLASFS